MDGLSAAAVATKLEELAALGEKMPRCVLVGRGRRRLASTPASFSAHVRFFPPSLTIRPPHTHTHPGPARAREVRREKPNCGPRRTALAFGLDCGFRCSSHWKHYWRVFYVEREPGSGSESFQLIVRVWLHCELP